MTTDIQLRQSDANLPELAGASVDPFGPYSRGGAAEGQPTIFTKLHRLLRGRYKWVVLLGGALGGACGYWGYRSQQPLYASTGMIHIKPVIAHLLYITPENSQLPMYNPYREAQVALLKDQRVIDKALTDAEWRALGRPGTQEEQWASFVRQFSAFAPTGNEMVIVRFEDADPEACKAAVKSVLTAYHQIYIAEEELSRAEKVRQLDTRRMSLTADRDAKREAITAIAANALTDDLRPVHTAKMTDLNRLESAIKDVEIQLAQLAQGGPATRPTDGQKEQKPKKSPVEMTVAEIALVDKDMRRLVSERDRMQREYDARVKALGPNNPRMVEARTNVELKLAEVEDYADLWRKAAVAAAGGDEALVLGDPKAQLRRQLENHRWELEELRTKARNEAKGIAQKMLDIEKLRREEGEINELLAETAKRLEQMKTEGNNTPRVQVVSWGNRPLQVKDSRVQMAVVGGGGGFVVGFGIVLGLSLLDRRLRSAEDAQNSSKLTLLGVLPSLPDDLADPEQAGIAAHCVHQIRTLLQIGHASQGRRVFAVTSPASGTGKTSLTLALGVSFAASNARTLIIDCDVIGGGLTHRVERIIKRRIGQIFKREGLVTQQQLELAMKLANNSQKKLGEILVELNFLTVDDVKHALDLQEGNPVGMLDALSGEPLEECVAETGIAGLHILPLGSAMPSDVSKLSPHTIGKLIRTAREQYDCVLIDTGPVPGSLEASVVAAEADGVVVVVSRGEHRPLAEKSIQHLQDIGARVAGMVFNRAEGRDMDLSTTNQRLSSIDRGGRKQNVEVVDPAQGERFGPVALAVATRQPASNNGTQKNQQKGPQQ
jgi:polysaccharide biosynthesis transport protein